MTQEEFLKEYDKRVDNRWLNHVYQTRSKLSPAEQREAAEIPMEILMETFKSGARVGLKVLSEMTKEGKV
jgi:hypothetical protein